MRMSAGDSDSMPGYRVRGLCFDTVQLLLTVKIPNEPNSLVVNSIVRPLETDSPAV